jgi:hypothetical protein
MFELINDGLHHCGFKNQITVIENHKYLALSLISSRTDFDFYERSGNIRSNFS